MKKFETEIFSTRIFKHLNKNKMAADIVENIDDIWLVNRKSRDIWLVERSTISKHLHFCLEKVKKMFSALTNYWKMTWKLTLIFAYINKNRV